MNNIQRDRENRGDIFVNKKIDRFMSRHNHIRKAKIFSLIIQLATKLVMMMRIIISDKSIENKQSIKVDMHIIF